MTILYQQQCVVKAFAPEIGLLGERLKILCEASRLCKATFQQRGGNGTSVIQSSAWKEGRKQLLKNGYLVRCEIHYSMTISVPHSVDPPWSLYNKVFLFCFLPIFRLLNVSVPFLLHIITGGGLDPQRPQDQVQGVQAEHGGARGRRGLLRGGQGPARRYDLTLTLTLTFRISSLYCNSYSFIYVHMLLFCNALALARSASCHALPDLASPTRARPHRPVCPSPTRAHAPPTPPPPPPNPQGTSRRRSCPCPSPAGRSRRPPRGRGASVSGRRWRLRRWRRL
jgi:hypothetical protein